MALCGDAEGPLTFRWLEVTCIGCKPPPEAVPDLDLDQSIPCGDEECLGNAASDGTSWWCETCGATWDVDGTRGQRDARQAAET